MRVLERVLFIVAFVFLSVNILRAVYQLWLEPTASVLDPYDESVDLDIREASSLGELLRRYDEAYGLVQVYENDEANPPVEYGDRDETEPYESEIKLRAAVEEWEARSKQIGKLRTFWFFGVGFLVVGFGAYKWLNQWLGISALIVAFSEMIYWTSPTYFGSRTGEFERLLETKCVLGFLSYGLLLLTAFLLGVFRENTRRARTS